MRAVASELIALIVLTPIACASTLEQRRDYILAHPHGWVEVSIQDSAIPALRSLDDPSAALVRPDSCSVEIRLDREPVVQGAVYPTGDSAPYAAASGFRFPVPIGPARIQLGYAGCDLESGNRSSVDVELEIAVEDGRVTEVRFDGSTLTALPTRDDSVVTLEDVYEAVTGGAKSGSAPPAAE